MSITRKIPNAFQTPIGYTVDSTYNKNVSYLFLLTSDMGPALRSLWFISIAGLGFGFGLGHRFCTVQILWERDPNLNASQWKPVLHNTM